MMLKHTSRPMKSPSSSGPMPHGHVGAKFHRGVNGNDITGALMQGKNRLIDHWQQNAVHNESWIVLGGHCRLPELRGDLFIAE